MNNIYFSFVPAPPQLKQLCNKYDIVPSKKYGQNFLISQAPIEKMIQAAQINTDETIVEIGPGFGILTFALANYAKKVVAFEIEKKLHKYWDKRPKNVEIVWGNALDKLKIESLKLNEYKVVANLPYQITSHALRTLLELENKPKSITVMVQKEVAQRIVAKPGDMSILSVSIQYYGLPKIICSVLRGNFWPSPDVDSAVIHIELGNHKRNVPDSIFFKFVKAGFANKRKQLWRNLKESLKIDSGIVKSVVKEVANNEKVRAQELSIEQWITLVSKLI